jgi:hypothetical protein
MLIKIIKLTHSSSLSYLGLVLGWIDMELGFGGKGFRYSGVKGEER